MAIVVSVALLFIVGGVVLRVARARIFEVLRMGGWE
jgi:hypothetical protein